ncbi:MAG: hypothetical protein RL660_847 [Bacteroidota bacterium]|jgi:hypothetical protein
MRIQQQLATLLLLLPLCINAQNKRGNIWLSGGFGGQIIFAGDTSRPTTRFMYNTSTPNVGKIGLNVGHSNICDSATGKLLFFCNGARIFDTTGAVMPDGDSLCSPYCFNQGTGYQLFNQSIILPKEGTTYYVFNTNFTDSSIVYEASLPPGGNLCGEELRYHVVDMAARNGLGIVTQRNAIACSTLCIKPSGLHAVRHANGQDWWLLMQGNGRHLTIDSFVVTRFLVSPSGISGPYEQNLGTDSASGIYEAGWMDFTPDGKRWLFGTDNAFAYGSFDRCTGLISNFTFRQNSVDSFYSNLFDTTKFYDSPKTGDYSSFGACWSPSGRLIYIVKRLSLYQFDTYAADSASAWHRLMGKDTTDVQTFTETATARRGPDGRVYIGTWLGGTYGHSAWQVIDRPDSIGTACSVQVRGLRPGPPLYNTGYLVGIPNMPNYSLGADPEYNPNCWPTFVAEYTAKHAPLQVYPNPNTGLFTLHHTTTNNQYSQYSIYNLHGALVQQGALSLGGSTFIDFSKQACGMYIVKVGTDVVKIHKD